LAPPTARIFTNSGYHLQASGLALATTCSPSVAQHDLGRLDGSNQDRSGDGRQLGEQPRLSLDAPSAGNVAQSFTVAGWAIDRGAGSSTGVDAVNVFAYPSNSSGTLTGAPYIALWPAIYGTETYVGAGLRLPLSIRLPSQASGLAPGYYLLVIWATHDLGRLG